MKQAIFLDRDGIIIEDTGFPGAVGKVIIDSYAVKAVKKLNELGFIIIIITNQSAVARGLFDENDVRRINREIAEYFLDNKAMIDAFYYCPHHPDGVIAEYSVKCDCRKPNPGLILKAVKEHNIDLSSSFFIGDSRRDVEAALAASTRPIYVNQKHEIELDVPSFTTLQGALNYIIENSEPK